MVIEFVVLGLILLAVGLFALLFLKRFLENSVIGIIALLVINYFGAAYGLTIGLNVITIVLAGLFGLAGVGLIVLLHFFGITIK